MLASEKQLIAAVKADPALALRLAKEILRRQSNHDGHLHPFYGYVPIGAQKDVLESKKKVTAFCTANQVGKSTTGGFAMACNLMAFNPLSPSDKYPGPGKYWACTKGDLIDGLIDKTEQFLPPSEVAWIRRSPLRGKIMMKSGRWCGFKTYDQPRTAYQQESLNGVWNDEEPPHEIWQEQQTRLIRFAGRTLLTFTPVDGSVWIHDLLFREENASWIDVFKMSMKENTYLPEEEVINYIKQFQDDPDQLAIRVDGDYRLMVGSKVFGAERIREAWEASTDPLRRATFDDDGKLRDAAETATNVWQLWEEPRKEFTYALGSDISLGGIRGDWTTALVYCLDTNRFTAMYRGKVDPYEWGDELVAAGRAWNDCIVSPELNGPGASTVARINHLGYQNLYRREVYTGAPRSQTRNSGWLTTKASKPDGISQFATAFSEGHIDVPMAPLLQEMRNFVWLRKDQVGMFGCGAASGHDDLVMAAMIAYMASRKTFRRNAFAGKTWSEALVAKLEAAAAGGAEEGAEESWD